MEKEQQKIQLRDVIVSDKVIQNLIYVVRGQPVLMDSDLAALYQVETKVLR